MTQEDGQNPQNPADRPLVTFDTNIIYSLRNNEPDAPAIRQLLTLNCMGVITVNVTLSTALEKQRPNAKLSMQDYAAWLQEQGIAIADIFSGPRTVGFHVRGDPPNMTTFDGRFERMLNERIHNIFFPNIPFSWYEYREQECERRSIQGIRRQALIELDALRWGGYIPPTRHAPMQPPTPALNTLAMAEQEDLRVLQEELHEEWANKKNDALGFYAHLTRAAHTTHPEYSVFVTNDGNFHRRTKLVELRQLGFRGEILRPAEAVTFLLKVTGVSLEAA